jgi:hypothetical protein
MKAGFLLSTTEPAWVAAAARVLDDAQALEAHAPARERGHMAAQRLVLEGRWGAACRVWESLLIDHPLDAFALQCAHLWDFYLGDAESLRRRPASVLPEWDEADPLFPYVLALHAFGLQECRLYPQAEDAGRRAAAASARVPWAVHAVAHVLEMQGRFEDGAAWLRQQQPQWAQDDNGFAAHLWWHLGLFRLEGLDASGVLRLIDAHLSGPALQITLQRLDATSLLWRLHLLGEDVSTMARELVAGWPLDDAHAGHYAFNDWHVVMALVGAGEPARAEAWLARCAARAMEPDDARRANHAMAREVGLPLMRGVLAFGRGDFDLAVTLMHPVQAVAQRFGGSHAQRDVIAQTLLAAASQCQRHRALGRALLNERLMAKPPTPLTRHWAQRLGVGAAMAHVEG